MKEGRSGVDHASAISTMAQTDGCQGVFREFEESVTRESKKSVTQERYGEVFGGDQAEGRRMGSGNRVESDTATPA